ncbi:hypothetical protein Moror_15682 [Moniliophthora roreri MCA 2997]|uniref:Reverse transcriptase domain-containing protein n=1 Tax=Moniliophthora roreri (strain MCA 2997) TaxID=1381753 RepID=V2WIT9_MONRO|nr:hypothetical protein Moror_15682 [Moniliophthora roreri MCA 2997]
MSLLNSDLITYVSEMRILPDTQVATQKNVQTRDLISFLAAIKCWSTWHKKPVYAIKRDQMKSFDYLSLEGMYDAVRAYSLPLSIIDLDCAAQTDTKCFICTAHGVTEPIIITGVTKQGGPLSPLKSTLTTSLSHHYLRDLQCLDPHVLVISSESGMANDPHHPIDNVTVPITMVEATDDSYIFSTLLNSLQSNILAMERFQYAYGWLT